MTGWNDLFAELDRWRAGKATFWWRDDDATIRTPALARLLALSDLPLSIAVVPACMRVSLAEQIAEPRIDVLQHGFSHTNYQSDDSKKAELGDARPLPVIQEELRRGWQRLSVLFGKRALRVLVPPWNRIDATLAATLPSLGYVGLSAGLEPRKASPEAGGDGLIRTNTHIDIVDWTKQPRCFAGETVALDHAVGHLAARRTGEADSEEATGFMTHHLAMDDDSFSFAAEFLKRTAAHPAVQWRAARDIFAVGKG
ncbi:MAG TPA: polysaccharide deacetylase family protein [Dongiaceae bacterium]|jgi:peptidoglycan/xylan/chitin deacetylase (PgdA/CDA1 family)